VTVSWEEARLFCEQLSRRTKLAVRLPSEAEWEYACRAGSASAFGWGEEKDEALLADYSWCRSNSGRQAHPVGLSKPNAWGLWDMHGNVLEWCSDWYDPRYYSSAPVQDPRGPEAGTHKVLRGGSWAQGADELRCAYREAAQPDAIGPTYGFRACIEVFAEPSETSTPQTVLPLMR
jgi:formylglycine-generating enzyme required for sulfatase activity